MAPLTERDKMGSLTEVMMPILKKPPLLKRVHALIDNARASGTTVISEETGHFSLDDDFVPKVRSLIDESIQLLREIGDHYEQVSVERQEPQPDEDQGSSVPTESGELSAREVADLAFVGRSQLSEKRDGLQKAVEGKQLWAAASHASTGLRRIGKALTAIDVAITEFEGLQLDWVPWVDLEDSLATRQVYGQFRRQILELEQEVQDDLPKGLKNASYRIAFLRKLHIYPYLRIDDRIAIKQLSRRIQAWLEDAGSNAEDGKRLWGDLVSFAHLLAKVNEREELREHDRRAVHNLVRRLFGGPKPVERLDGELLEELTQLEGLDLAIDAVIQKPAGHSVASLREPLERLQENLRRKRTGSLGLMDSEDS